MSYGVDEGIKIVNIAIGGAVRGSTREVSRLGLRKACRVERLSIGGLRRGFLEAIDLGLGRGLAT